MHVMHIKLKKVISVCVCMYTRPRVENCHRFVNLFFIRMDLVSPLGLKVSVKVGFSAFFYYFVTKWTLFAVERNELYIAITALGDKNRTRDKIFTTFFL